MIFVAKKVFEAYLISSAALLLVDKYFAPLEINGEYKFFKIFEDFLSLDPTTTYLINKISDCFPFSQKFRIWHYRKYFLFILFAIIFSSSSPVVTGTDLFIIILNLFIDLDISFPTEKTE